MLEPQTVAYQDVYSLLQGLSPHNMLEPQTVVYQGVHSSCFTVWAP